VAHGSLFLFTLEGGLVPEPGPRGIPRHIGDRREDLWNFCPKCGFLLPAESPPAECAACGEFKAKGEETVRGCATCGRPNPFSASYCTCCGARQYWIG
jgi:hypothetical protein